LNFIKKKYEDVSYRPKLTWRVIREMLDRNKKSVKDEIKAIKINNNIVQTNTNQNRVANVFNDFFISVASMVQNLSQVINSTTLKHEPIFRISVFKTVSVLRSKNQRLPELY